MRLNANDPGHIVCGGADEGQGSFHRRSTTSKRRKKRAAPRTVLASGSQQNSRAELAGDPGFAT